MTRRPLSFESSLLILAPSLCYYVTAILVILPRTFLVRIAILPLTFYFALRASTQLDLAAGDSKLAYLNYALVVREPFLTTWQLIYR